MDDGDGHLELRGWFGSSVGFFFTGGKKKPVELETMELGCK